MWLIAGFGSLGLLVGWLTGLSASGIVATLLPLLFALMGGSVIVFLDKIAVPRHSLAGGMILAFSLSCILGTVGAIYVAEHHLLSPGHLISAVPSSPAKAALTQPKPENPKADQPNDSDLPATRNKYLRSILISDADVVDVQYRNGTITAKQAYDDLYDLLHPFKGKSDASGESNK